MQATKMWTRWGSIDLSRVDYRVTLAQGRFIILGRMYLHYDS